MSAWGARRARVGLVAGGVAAALLLWSLGGRAALERFAAPAAFPRIAGELTTSAVRAAVDVDRDDRGIPHIDARSERDAWAALGFVHAQDRLAQMLWLRRLAQGRVSEVAGEAGLDVDRVARILGIARHAAAQAERMPPDVAELVQAYADGVNARVARVREGLAGPPLELVRHGPLEDWTRADSIAVLKLVSWAAGPSVDTQVVLDDLVQRLGSNGARPFFPLGGDFAASGMLPAEAEPPAAPPPPERSDRAGPAAFLAVRLFGGNAWVLSGRRTASGAPILASDLELAPTAPALVYEAQIRGGSLDVAGATIPGIPGVWSGRNDGLAWAATPALAVTTDVFKETLRRSDEDALYHDGGRWRPLETREEVIHVRGAAGGLREERLVVRSTHHGPLINDLLPDPATRPPLALAWTGAVPGSGLASLLGLSRAGSAGELIDVLREHHEPVLAVAYADAEGRGGVQVAGWLPRHALPSGLTPVPGRLRGFDWRAKVPYEVLPSEVLARGRSWVIAADAAFSDRYESQSVEWLWRPGVRAAHLESLLSRVVAEGPVDLHRAAAVQAGLAEGRVPGLVPALLELAGPAGSLSPEAGEVAHLLEGWGGDLRASSPGASAYHILVEHLIEELFAPRLGEALLARYLALPHTRGGALVEQLIREAAERPQEGGWTDRAEVSAAVRRSLHRTGVSLVYRLGPNRARWRWGRLHRVAFRPFASLVASGEPARAGLGPFPLAGGSPSPLRYDAHEAATYRGVADLASPDRMLTTLAPGQAEHPHHVHYADGIERWLSGRPSLLVMSRFLVEEQTVERLVLDPET